MAELGDIAPSTALRLSSIRSRTLWTHTGIVWPLRHKTHMQSCFDA
jgi:hypothetical protein